MKEYNDVKRSCLFYSFFLFKEFTYTIVHVTFGTIICVFVPNVMCWLFIQPNDQNTFLTINSMKRFHEKFMKVKYIKIQSTTGKTIKEYKT